MTDCPAIQPSIWNTLRGELWTNIAIKNGPVEIVDFPMKHGDFPWQNVSSPEGKPPFSYDFPMVFLLNRHVSGTPPGLSQGVFAKVTHDGFAIQRLVGPHGFLFTGQLPRVFWGDPQGIQGGAP